MLDEKDLELLQTMMTQIVAESEARMTTKIESSIASSEARMTARSRNVLRTPVLR